MSFPLGFFDFSLFFGFLAILLLLVSGLRSQYYGRVNILVDKKRLRNASIAMSIVFLATVALRIVIMLLPI